MSIQWKLGLMLALWIVVTITGTLGLGDPRHASDSHDHGSNTETPKISADTGLPVLDRRGDIKKIIDKGLWPVHVMATGFVGGAVQFKYLSELEEKLLTPFTSFDDLVDSFEEWEEWVTYFIGFTVCAAVGVVAFLAMLISFLVWPCCRCCGKCGGTQDPMDTKKSDTQRLGCAVTLIIFNCILVLGVTCMLVTNEHMNHQLVGEETVFDNIATGVNDVQPFLVDSVNDINASVLQRYSVSKDLIFLQLYALPKTAVVALDNVTQLVGTFNQLNSFADDLEPLNDDLAHIEINSGTLQSNTSSLNETLILLKQNITDALSDCFNRGDPDCYKAGNLTESLSTNVEYSAVNVSKAKTATDMAMRSGFEKDVNNIEGNITEIMSKINQTTFEAVSEADDQANEIEDEIANVVKDLESGVNELNFSQIDVVMEDVEEAFENEHIADIVYFSIMGLACTLCLIIFTNLIGLIHGFACPRPKPDSSCTDCDTNQAYRWLLTSSAMTFIFYWIYVLVVMVTFIAGGVIYSEVCRNVIDFNESNSVEVLDIMDVMIDDAIESDTIQNIAVFDAYRKCERNETIYEALRLAENGYNITDMLDLTEIEDAIDEIKQLDITLPPITLYTANLGSILNQLEVDVHLDYDSMKHELEKNVTNIDLNKLADDLEALDEPDVAYGISALRDLAENDVSEIHMLARDTIHVIEHVEAPLENTNFTALGASLQTAEQTIDSEGEEIVENFVDLTADQVLVNITNVSQVIINDIENSVANCRDLYVTVTTLVDDTCVRALYPLNVFWFSLGWCLLFLIPYLIMSLKLSNLYKKTVPYVKDYGGADFPEDMQLQPAVNVGVPPAYAPAHAYDDLQPMDNLGFDPMYEYRQQISRQASEAYSSSYASQLPPGPSTKFDPSQRNGSVWVLPRPIVKKSTSQDLLVPHYGGKSQAGPLGRKVPAPEADYGEVDSGDPDLAYLY